MGDPTIADIEAIADPCGDVHMGGFSNIFDCVLPSGHSGNHRSFGGSEWGWEPVSRGSGNG